MINKIKAIISPSFREAQREAKERQDQIEYLEYVESLRKSQETHRLYELAQFITDTKVSYKTKEEADQWESEMLATDLKLNKVAPNWSLLRESSYNLESLDVNALKLS